MFSDADLLGTPIRLIISPNNLKENLVELTTRDKQINQKVNLPELIPTIKTLITSLNNQQQK